MIQQKRVIGSQTQPIAKKPKVRASQKFVAALGVVSIIGFLMIALQAFFDLDFNLYMNPLLMVIIGIGLMFEVGWYNLKYIKTIGLTQGNFSSIIIVVLGFFAVVTGVLSLPEINNQNPTFIAIKGIISLIAIIFIVIQTWVVERNVN